jgi:hypothetical protein
MKRKSKHITVMDVDVASKTQREQGMDLLKHSCHISDFNCKGLIDGIRVSFLWLLHSLDYIGVDVDEILWCSWRRNSVMFMTLEGDDVIACDGQCVAYKTSHGEGMSRRIQNRPFS